MEVEQLVEVGGMEGVVGDVGYGIEPVSGGVDSASRSVVEELRSAPESELETADPLDHLHKIGQGIPSTGFHPMSTSIQGRWESVPGTWQQCQVE